MLRTSRHWRFALLLVAAWTAAGGVRVGTGGDPIDAYLSRARSEIVGTLKRLTANYPANVPELTRFCQTGGATTDEMRLTCVDFLISTSASIVRCNEASPPTPLVAWRPDAPDEFIASYRDGERPVAAMTTEGCATPVYFHYDKVRDMLRRDIIILMMHEFGHKVPYKGAYLGDAESIGGFYQAADLLNAAASALLLYGKSGGGAATIAQDGVDIGILRDAYACVIEAGTAAPVHFSSFSRRVQQGAWYESNTDSDESIYGHPLNRYLPQNAADPNYIQERLFLKMRVRGADPCDAAWSQNMTDFFLMRQEGSGAVPLTEASVTLPRNALCEPQLELLSAYRSLNQVPLTLNCSFDGRHRR